MKDRNQANEKRALGRAFFAQHMLEAAHFERAGFHMPGHRGGNVYPASLKEHFLDLDLTELPITEDLNDPGPILRDVEQRWGRALGGSDLMFLTAGSSCGIKGGLFALAGFQGDVIALSPVHKAYFQAASLLNLTTSTFHKMKPSPKPILKQHPATLSPRCSTSHHQIISAPSSTFPAGSNSFANTIPRSRSSLTKPMVPISPG